MLPEHSGADKTGGFKLFQKSKHHRDKTEKF